MTDPTTSPIVVNATPTVDMWQAGLRYAITAASAVLAALGYAGLAGKASALLLAVGPVAALGAFLWGLWATRKSSNTKTELANMLPDDKAQTK